MYFEAVLYFLNFSLIVTTEYYERLQRVLVVLKGRDHQEEPRRAPGPLWLRDPWQRCQDKYKKIGTKAIFIMQRRIKANFSEFK